MYARSITYCDRLESAGKITTRNADPVDPVMKEVYHHKKVLGYSLFANSELKLVISQVPSIIDILV